MHRRGWIAGAALVLAAGSWTASARAGDTLRLGGVVGDNTPTLTLDLRGGAGADTLEVTHRYYGYYRPHYYGAYYRPYYYPRYYPSYSFSFSFGYPRPYYYAPRYYYGGYYGYYRPYRYLYIGLDCDAEAYTGVLGGLSHSYAEKPADMLPAPRTLPQDGTYPYDGGPKNPVPKADPRQPAPPQDGIPLEGKAVSVPAPPTKFAYPAYGEEPGKSSFAEDRVLRTKKAGGK